MKPPDSINTPEEIREWVKDQIPWLKSPSNPIPTVSADGLKSPWKLQNDLEAKYGKEERQPGEIIGN